jgi:hypothetical protein
MNADRPATKEKNRPHRNQRAAIGPERITFKEGAWYVDLPRPDWFIPETWSDMNPPPWRVTDPKQVALVEACKRRGAPLWVNLAHGPGQPPAFTDREPVQEPDREPVQEPDQGTGTP